MIVPSCLLQAAMGHALARRCRPAGSITRSRDVTSSRHDGSLPVADPFALVEALAAAGRLDRGPAQFQGGDARARPGLAAAVQLDEHRTPLLPGRQLAQRPAELLAPACGPRGSAARRRTAGTAGGRRGRAPARAAGWRPPAAARRAPARRAATGGGASGRTGCWLSCGAGAARSAAGDGRRRAPRAASAGRA